jgi:hypothetical protein
VWNNLGFALFGKGDVDGAIAEYREAIRLDPKLALAHTNLGTIYLQRKNFPDALACARAAIRADPKYSNAHAMLGVGGRATTRGSRAAIRAAACQGAAAVRAKVWTPDELKAKAATARRIGLRPPTRWTPARGGWTADQVALLGTDHDEAIAGRIGRSPGAVTSKRVGLKIAAYSGQAGGGRSWTATEVTLLGTDRDAVIAKKTGRTVRAVTSKRTALNVPAASGWRGGGRPWTAEEVALVGTARDEVIAAKIGRTPMAVTLRRVAMKLPVFADRRRPKHGNRRPLTRRLGVIEACARCL